MLNMFYVSLQAQTLKCNTLPVLALLDCICKWLENLIFCTQLELFGSLMVPVSFLVLFHVVEQQLKNILYYLFPCCQKLDSDPSEIFNVRAHFQTLVTCGDSDVLIQKTASLNTVLTDR